MTIDKASLVKKLDNLIEWDRLMRSGQTMIWHPSISIDDYKAMRALLAEVHPITETIRVVNYLGALQNHDWSYEFSDDHSVWLRGTESLAALKKMQADVDPGLEIWNVCAPERYRRTQG